MLPKKINIIKSLIQFKYSDFKVILKEDCLYDGLSKEEFLDKLKGFFYKFLISNNYPGMVFTLENNDFSANNKFSLIVTGNHSLDFVHFDFYFDKNNDIQIRKCNFHETTSVKKSPYGSSFFSEYIVIENPDDIKLYQYNSGKCFLALSELRKNNNGYLKKIDYLPWLEKYKDLYESFYKPPIDNIHFSNLFCDIFENLIEISELFKLDKIVNLAINDFKSIDQSVEFIILNWLVKYEKTFIKVFNIYYPIFTSDVENGFLSLALIKDFYFSIEDFKNVLDFFSLFEDIYYEKLMVYNTFPINKLNELSDSQQANNFSLEYHLKKRGMI